MKYKPKENNINKLKNYLAKINKNINNKIVKKLLY